MMPNLLLDSNIVIYASQADDTAVRPLMAAHTNFVAAITRIEVLGFRKLSVDQESIFRSIFSTIEQLPLNELVIEQAITLKRIVRIDTPDAVIAATALVHRMPLCTRNVNDFKAIEGLSIINPFDSD
ncbi:MAG TPA: type II toxin-antitoxin system VapC family toxin [Tepidisphaeraceae bacterium]|jgi:hypothetical protein